MNQEILVVDDEKAIREIVADILVDEGYRARSAATGREALSAIEQRRPHMVLLDVWLEGSDLDGLQVLDAIQANDPDMPVVVISGHGTIETAVSAIRKGAYDFLEKPFKSDRLLVAVERALETARLRRENAELRRRAGESDSLVGKSSALSVLRQAVDKAAPTGSRILISGPPGSGKEVVARLIHRQSKRANGPFVVLNAATLEPERVGAELFGSENGEAGQSVEVRPGTFERADTGTLFIDEVADMPLETQGKLVRVLQEQAFVRIGGRRQVEVDVRVLAATARPLDEEISAGRFREDLFYRLNVVPLTVPPLSQRREDIPLLVEHFVERLSESTGMPPRQFAPDAMATLQTTDWPGNVRELKNAVERILIMAPGDAKDAIHVDNLPPEIVHGANAELDISAGDYMSLPLREARERFERYYLKAQLDRFGGNVSRTAMFVGMERSALHRKLRALELQGDG